MSGTPIPDVQDIARKLVKLGNIEGAISELIALNGRIAEDMRKSCEKLEETQQEIKKLREQIDKKR